LRDRDLLYDLLQDKTRGQLFYNEMMVRQVNPRARELFKSFRDDEERDVQKVRKQFLTLESKPMIFKTVMAVKNSTFRAPRP